MEILIGVLFAAVIYLAVLVYQIKSKQPISTKKDDKGNTLLINSKGETILEL